MTACTRCKEFEAVIRRAHEILMTCEHAGIDANRTRTAVSVLGSALAPAQPERTCLTCALDANCPSGHTVIFPYSCGWKPKLTVERKKKL